MAITYKEEGNLSLEEFAGILERSTLARRRPATDPARLKTMLANADIILCARDGNKLVGISRAITDYSYCCYLSDLAVDVAYQRRGIGKELIKRTHEIAGDRTTLHLMSAPDSMTYYENIGMTPITNGWKIDRTE